MAKHRKEMQQTGTELSPLDLFKLFHVRKNGIWASNKAKEMHETMESMRSTVGDQGLTVDEWKIYREVTGEPAHGRVIGWGSRHQRQGCVWFSKSGRILF